MTALAANRKAKEHGGRSEACGVESGELGVECGEACGVECGERREERAERGEERGEGGMGQDGA
jgi:hypothetical protein